MWVIYNTLCELIHFQCNCQELTVPRSPLTGLDVVICTFVRYQSPRTSLYPYSQLSPDTDGVQRFEGIADAYLPRPHHLA